MDMIRKVSILGLGLIGGSLAKAIRERTGIDDIYAYSRTYRDVEKAHGDGVVTKPFKEITDEFLGSDIVFICTQVSTSIDILRKHKDHFGEKTIITDVGSTKGIITQAAMELGLSNFIGGHPMAGSEKTGYDNSAAHMFENAFYILTASPDTSEDILKKMIYIVTSIGAIPLTLDAKEHDFVTAAISHLPHVIASSLVGMAGRLNREDNNVGRLAAGGFKDLTRIASSSPVMWENICMQNRDNIDILIGEYISELGMIRKMIKEGNVQDMHRFFEEAKNYRDQIKDRVRGQYDILFDISVDIEDKPGAIAKVAGILAECNINVKNIGIPANREFEKGCLIISFDDESTRIRAISVLNKNGVKAYKR